MLTVVADPAQRPAPATPPGLTVLAVYLRPVERTSLLVPLSQLGLFVHEVTGEQLPWVLTSVEPTPDLVVVVGDDRPAHLQTVSDLTVRLTPALLGIWPDGADTSAAQAAGAMAVVPDARLAALSAAVVPVARLARTIREARAAAVSTRLFGHLTLRSNPARLDRETGSVGLSVEECIVAELLTASLGKPVALSDLQFALKGAAGPGGDAEVRLGPLIAGLRRKAAQLGGRAELLTRVKGFGYVLAG